MNQKKFLTVSQVAGLLCLHRSSIYRYVATNTIPHAKLPGGKLIFEEGKILEWVKKYEKLPLEFL